MCVCTRYPVARGPIAKPQNIINACAYVKNINNMYNDLAAAAAAVWFSDTRSCYRRP